METAQEEFQVRVYLKTELAQLYAPHLDPEAALRKMRKWIHLKAEKIIRQTKTQEKVSIAIILLRYRS